MSLRSLREAPITLPCLAAVALLGWWAADDGGYAVSRWAPGTVAVLVLLGVALVAVPNPWRELAPAVRVATAGLAAYTVWSLASLLWAGDPGAAWEGGLRTLLYLAIFCLFALWRHRPDTGLLLLAGWVLVVELVFLVLFVRLGAAGDPRSFFADDRLVDPAGYPNATAALALMAFWPALVLAAARAVPWGLRAVCAGGAVVLADAALLAASRGAAIAFPLTAVVLLVVLPGRLRHAAALAVTGLAAALAAPAILDATDALGRSGNPSGAVARAVQLSLLGMLAAAAATAGLAWWETRRPPRPDVAARIARGGRLAAGATLVVGLVAALALAGNPVDRAHSAWGSFKGGYGENTGHQTRLLSGLGSNRYDFYRVGLDDVLHHPVAGLGADNFQQSYLRLGTSDETPRYPHSIVIRTLAETGLVGAVLLLAALAGMLAAAWRGLRQEDERARAVTGAALMAGVYWLVHGSADWFFEYAGLGAAAFVLLGLAAGLLPRGPAPARAQAPARAPAPARAQAPARAPAPARAAGAPRGAAGGRRRLAIAGGVALLLAAAAAPLTLWMADSEVSRAGDVFARRPAEALDRLSRAASLDPFSGRPDGVAGSVALRYGDLPRADRAFARVLDRVPDDQYATLERGAIASASGRPAAALTLLTRAARLAPRDRLTREALAIVRSGGVIDVTNLNRRILLEAQKLGR